MRGSRRPAETRPASVGRLAVLPLFVDLDGKPALVAGGTPAAAWKAELLAGAGAEVCVATDEPCPELTALLTAGAAGGRLTLLPRPWRAGDLADVAIAVVDAADDAEAERFVEAARLAGVPCNVIDRPAFGTFRFGSIVNRSPVVIGIATTGAAPILAQAIRQKIETLLPPALAEWAALAARLRRRVAERLVTPASRRSFWEALARRAFGPAPQGSDEAAFAQLRSGDDGSAGRVTLVGAGPGDAGLLTISAVRALQSADVILFDAPVSHEILELARREARRVPVGEGAGRVAGRPEDVTGLMTKLARQGSHVVRLQTGDPATSGRAGEELDRLMSDGIPVAVVPGITAAGAAAATLVASPAVRHRRRSGSVTRYGVPGEPRASAEGLLQARLVPPVLAVATRLSWPRP